jgi:CheY-like chemotaxis protein
MPGVDGWRGLRRVNADAGLRTIPVVVPASPREERDLMESYRSGANAYVVKPIHFNGFAEAMPGARLATNAGVT